MLKWVYVRQKVSGGCILLESFSHDSVTKEVEGPARIKSP